MPELRELQNPRFARMWIKLSERSDKHGADDHRRRLLAGLSGRVVEVGAGNGLNFRHYPPEVTEVVAVEPDDTLRGVAESAARTAPVPVRVVAGQADALPAEDGSVDAVVVSLVLCTVPDPSRTLREIKRVLLDGGELRFYEHVRSDKAFYGRFQDLITPIWSRAGGGCHPNRTTQETIAAVGFRVREAERFLFHGLPLGPATTHVIGRGEKP